MIAFAWSLALKYALTPAGKAVGAFVLAVALIAGLYTFGYSSGRAAGRVEQLRDSVKAYEKRMGIDDDTNNLGRVDLCIELGGLRDECQQLRGLDAAAKGQ
jgi:hypothetical protein